MLDAGCQRFRTASLFTKTWRFYIFMIATVGISALVSLPHSKPTQKFDWESGPIPPIPDQVPQKSHQG